MTSARAAGTLLAASADDRTLEYLLLPYGEQGRTNMGLVSAGPGSVTIPDRLVANMQHDEHRPVATADREDIRETDRGLVAKFHVLPTTQGDDLLAEARAGVRSGVSVELDPVVIRAGRLVSGLLAGAGFVTKPAFPTARLVAEDAGELPDDEDTDDGDGQDQAADDQTSTTETPDADGAGDDTKEDGTVPPTTAPPATATAPAGGLVASRHSKDDNLTAAGFSRLLADAHRAGGVRGLQAALADIVPANTVGTDVPQYVGELWDGKAYQRKIIPLFNHATLTSFEVRGWRWVTRPQVGPYTGDKTEVPSNAVQTEAVVIAAERIAGAHDIDRKHRDFNDSEFFSAYNRAMTESYAEVSDAQVALDILAAAPAVTPGTVPTDVAAGLAYIVDGGLAILNATDTAPTFALVATNLWRDIVLSPKDNSLEYLNTAFGLEDGSLGGFRIIPSKHLSPDQVLVGTRSAATVHELGTVPIRVEAEDVANGGVDVGVFGYYATNVHDADGLALVQPAAG